MLEARREDPELERQIFQNSGPIAAGHASRIRATAAAVAEMDLTVALAEGGRENRYVVQFSESGEMRVVAGRHPVIEKLTESRAQRIIPNELPG